MGYELFLLHLLIHLYIPGLAEAGLISSKLSRHDISSTLDEDQGPFHFSPERLFTINDISSTLDFLTYSIALTGLL